MKNIFLFFVSALLVIVSIKGMTVDSSFTHLYGLMVFIGLIGVGVGLVEDYYYNNQRRPMATNVDGIPSPRTKVRER